jgi:hypothetical protein
MPCSASLHRRWPVLLLVYAFALQAIAVTWSGVSHGWGAVDGPGAICRPMASSPADAASGTVPLSPSHQHDCAFACLNALGGGPFSLAEEAALHMRDISGPVALADNGIAFQYLRIASAAFAARAPPRLI